MSHWLLGQQSSPFVVIVITIIHITIEQIASHDCIAKSTWLLHLDFLMFCIAINCCCSCLHGWVANYFLWPLLPMKTVSLPRCGPMFHPLFWSIHVCQQCEWHIQDDSSNYTLLSDTILLHLAFFVFKIDCSWTTELTIWFLFYTDINLRINHVFITKYCVYRFCLYTISQTFHSFHFDCLW